MERSVDFSRFTRRAEKNEETRQQQSQQQLRSQAEAANDYYRKRLEQENRSNFSGGVWGGRVDRSR